MHTALILLQPASDSRLCRSVESPKTPPASKHQPLTATFPDLVPLKLDSRSLNRPLQQHSSFAYRHCSRPSPRILWCSTSSATRETPRTSPATGRPGLLKSFLPMPPDSTALHLHKKRSEDQRRQRCRRILRPSSIRSSQPSYHRRTQ